MCGRFTLTRPDLDEVAEFLDAVLPREAAVWRPRYNVAPTDTHWIARCVDGARELTPAHWGLLVDGKPPLINVRAEQAPGRFGAAWRGRRCVVPADGFYEWGGGRGARRPTWFHATDGKLLAMAGLFAAAADGHLLFAILTRAADPTVAPVHDRMPLLLARDRVGAWLDGGEPDPARAPSLAAVAVSARVNSVAHDDADCLRPAAQIDLFTERS